MAMNKLKSHGNGIFMDLRIILIKHWEVNLFILFLHYFYS